MTAEHSRQVLEDLQIFRMHLQQPAQKKLGPWQIAQLKDVINQLQPQPPRDCRLGGVDALQQSIDCRLLLPLLPERLHIALPVVGQGGECQRLRDGCRAPTQHAFSFPAIAIGRRAGSGPSSSKRLERGAADQQWPGTNTCHPAEAIHHTGSKQLQHRLWLVSKAESAPSVLQG